jgi:hypothetical protein
LRVIAQGFQQSYPQFIGTASKGHEKQQLTRCFKNIYEQESHRMQGRLLVNVAHKVLNAKVA